MARDLSLSKRKGAFRFWISPISIVHINNKGLDIAMMEHESSIGEFFDHYAARVNSALKGEKADVEGVVGDFADNFIEASPLGIAPGKNDEDFKAAIPKGWDFYKRIGIRSMDILSKTITLLDGFHAMAEIEWQSLFVRKDGSTGVIVFEVIYLVQLRAKGIKIFAYITGDEQQALRDSGLVS